MSTDHDRNSDQGISEPLSQYLKLRWKWEVEQKQRKKKERKRLCIVNEKHRVYLPPSVSVTILQEEGSAASFTRFFPFSPVPV